MFWWARHALLNLTLGFSCGRAAACERRRCLPLLALRLSMRLAGRQLQALVRLGRMSQRALEAAMLTW